MEIKIFNNGMNKMEKEILAFIDYLKSEIKDRPQCFMFALLLKCKFERAVIFSSMNHCITLIDGDYYDWDGVAEKPEKRFSEFPEKFGDKHIVNYYYALEERFVNNSKL